MAKYADVRDSLKSLIDRLTKRLSALGSEEQGTQDKNLKRALQGTVIPYTDRAMNLLAGIILYYKFQNGLAKKASDIPSDHLKEILADIDLALKFLEWATDDLIGNFGGEEHLNLIQDREALKEFRWQIA